MFWVLPVIDNSFTKEKLENLIDFPQIEGFLKSNEELPLLYYEKIDELWLKLLTIKSSDKDWLSDLNEILLNSYKLYYSNQEFISWLCKMNGMLLSLSDRLEQVKYGLEKMFSLAHTEYSNNMINMANIAVEPPPLMRYAVAEAFGYVSINHFDVVLEKIRQIFNAEIVGKKQSTGLASFFMKGSSGDEGNISIKITLVLALGFIAKHANITMLYNKIEGAIINNILPFMDKPTNYQLKVACQKAILTISNALERMYSSPQLQIDEQFKIFITRHREKLLEKSTSNYLSEKPNDLKIFSLNSLSSLLRLEPPYECEKYHWLFNESIDLLWENKENKEVIEAFSEVLEAILYHERLFFSPKDGLDMGSMNYWELIVWIMSRIEKKIEEANEKKILSFLIKFFRGLRKNLKVKKIDFANKNNKKNWLKVLLNVMSFSYYDIPEFRSIVIICVNKVVKVAQNEEDEDLIFENVQSFNQSVLKSISNNLSIDDAFFIIEEIIDILKNSQYYFFILIKIITLIFY